MTKQHLQKSSFFEFIKFKTLKKIFRMKGNFGMKEEEDMKLDEM